MTRHRMLRGGMAAAALVGCATTPPDETACDRACLVELGHAVVSGAKAIAPEARVTENGMDIKLADTWLERARSRSMSIDVHGEYADAATGTVIVIGTGDDSDGRPSVFGLRLRHHAEQVEEAELIVTHDGEVSLFPPSTPLPRRGEFSEIVAPGARTSPVRMLEIANAYFDGIEVDSGANVPITDDCERIENGVQTTNTERFMHIKCNSLEPFDYITEVRERRFPVVDAERGVVAGLVAFYIPGGDYPRVVEGMQTTRHYDARALFLIEAFKIENAKVRLVEATMRNMPLGSTLGWGPEQ